MYYLVTELATGGDLCTHIKEQPAGKLDENTARLYARQLVAALKHMHSRGVVHRWVIRVLAARIFQDASFPKSSARENKPNLSAFLSQIKRLIYINV